MRSAAMSAIPPLSEEKRTLWSHLAGSINSVACRADRRATVVRWRCRGSFRPRLTRQGPKEPRGLVPLFGRGQSFPAKRAHDSSSSRPAGPALGGLFLVTPFYRAEAGVLRFECSSVVGSPV